MSMIEKRRRGSVKSGAAGKSGESWSMQIPAALVQKTLLSCLGIPALVSGLVVLVGYSRSTCATGDGMTGIVFLALEVFVGDVVDFCFLLLYDF